MPVLPPLLSARPASVRATAVAAGLLWMPYGALELLQPFGPDTRYDEALGYDVVVDPGRFVGYSLPGSVALVLSGLALVALTARLPGRSRGARAAGATAAALGAVSALGVVVQVDPVFTGPRIVGTLLLGAGLLGAAAAAPAGRRLLLAALGAVGLLLLPLWPLVYALQWMSAGTAAGVFVLFGAGWLALGAGSPATAPPAVPLPAVALPAARPLPSSVPHAVSGDRDQAAALRLGLRLLARTPPLVAAAVAPQPRPGGSRQAAPDVPRPRTPACAQPPPVPTS